MFEPTKALQEQVEVTSEVTSPGGSKILRVSGASGAGGAPEFFRGCSWALLPSTREDLSLKGEQGQAQFWPFRFRGLPPGLVGAQQAAAGRTSPPCGSVALLHGCLHPKNGARMHHNACTGSVPSSQPLGSTGSPWGVSVPRDKALGSSPPGVTAPWLCWQQ